MKSFENTLPKLVIAPGFVLGFAFIYGFMVWNGILSVTASRMLPNYDEFVGLAQYARLWDMDRWWLALRQGLDIAVLLAEFGFSSRSAFVSELFERIRLKLLPATPETTDAAVLFSLVLPKSSEKCSHVFQSGSNSCPGDPEPTKTL